MGENRRPLARCRSVHAVQVLAHRVFAVQAQGLSVDTRRILRHSAECVPPPNTATIAADCKAAGRQATQRLPDCQPAANCLVCRVMSTVAEQMRRAREEQSLTVHQVSDITKIKTDHIRALEDG